LILPKDLAFGIVALAVPLMRFIDPPEESRDRPD
jgi:hypothetical protein